MISLIFGLIITLVISAHFNLIESSLSSSVIRLHIIAESNLLSDQMLKLKVRDAIIKNTKNIFTKNKNIEDAKLSIKNNTEFLKSIAEKEIQKNGFDYKVNVTFGKSDFPTKVYNNITLPKGSYDALKIEIGNAKGKNWWCVMFPPMCFTDYSSGQLDTESINYLKSSLSKEEFKLISYRKDIPVKIEFKIYELWQNGKEKFKDMFKK
jgi:stage II sporulation protein R